MNILLTLALTFLLTLTCGCGNTDTASGSAKLKIVATTTMIGDLVKQIGGDQVDVAVIMGAGVDPHTYKPSTSDLGAIARADAVFYNGLHLEGKMVELFEEKIPAKAFAVAEGVADKGRLLPWKEGTSEAHDPHIWFDVTLWIDAARHVGEMLAKIDAPQATAYKDGAAKYVQELTTLDAYVRERIAAVPEARRVLITSHDAYNYFAKAYGFRVRGIQGISTETEAGLAGIASAVDFILKDKIPALFVETSVPHNTIERVLADVQSRGFNARLGGELYSDAMGAPGERPGYAVETYAGMVRYNIDTICSALSAEVKP